jgi:MoxR-like ATPase
MNSGVPALNAAVQEASAFLPTLMTEINRCVVGQKYLVERLVIGLLANGHVLLEGVPGLAKTLSVKTLATAMHVKFSRLQFTPDMLPADVVGTQIYNPAGGFTTRKGPVFANPDVGIFRLTTPKDEPLLPFPWTTHEDLSLPDGEILRVYRK